MSSEEALDRECHGGFGYSGKLSPLVTCEHGGNRIPKRYQSLFAGSEVLLASHRGWDPGALPLARALAATLSAPLHFSRVSRLLVDLNRSLHNPRVFSEVTRKLPKEEKERILNRWYHPYRNSVAAAVEEGISRGRTMLHLAIHTFTPVLDGKVREVEIGALYDPARRGETAFAGLLAGQIQNRLGSRHPEVRIRRNRPYLGKADGLPTALRKQFSDDRYLGIEIEVGQGLILHGKKEWRGVRKNLLDVLATLSGD